METGHWKVRLACVGLGCPTRDGHFSLLGSVVATDNPPPEECSGFHGKPAWYRSGNRTRLPNLVRLRDVVSGGGGQNWIDLRLRGGCGGGVLLELLGVDGGGVEGDVGGDDGAEGDVGDGVGSGADEDGGSCNGTSVVNLASSSVRFSFEVYAGLRRSIEIVTFLPLIFTSIVLSPLLTTGNGPSYGCSSSFLVRSILTKTCDVVARSLKINGFRLW